MEKKSLLKRILEKIRLWLYGLLRHLFPAEVLQQMGIPETAEASGEPADRTGTASGTGGSAAGGTRGAASERNSLSEEDEPSEEELQRMKETPVERRHILFFGRVQGVGFRYQAMYAARNFGLTGWVANLLDGSVEMEIQGPSAGIDHMIRKLENGRWISIDAMDSQRIPLVEGERGFRVQGY